jgi:hypothetical protein
MEFLCGFSGILFAFGFLKNISEHLSISFCIEQFQENQQSQPGRNWLLQKITNSFKAFTDKQI